ncbi:MAG: hypothetical protein QM784_15095 [Polyangiaceae bacterium]
MAVNHRNAVAEKSGKIPSLREHYCQTSGGDTRGDGVLWSTTCPMVVHVDMDGVLGPALSERIAEDLSSALRRRPGEEGRLCGALYALIPWSPRLSDAAVAALDVLVRRKSFERPLYGGLLRCLVELGDPHAAKLLRRALDEPGGGGLSTIVAAALCPEPALGEALVRLLQSRSTTLAFAAELARAARGESEGAALRTLAPRIKESARIELFTQVILPLSRAKRALPGYPAAAAVFRDTERHLGRWLCLAEVALASGDGTVLAEARRRAESGAAGARAAWELLAWALDSGERNCEVRPTVELMARLSDRPSAERELSFLFRMAARRQPTAKTMLENLVKDATYDSAPKIRAVAHLIRDYGHSELKKVLVGVAKGAKREPLRGLALAALYDLERSQLDGLTLDLNRSRSVQTAIWSALVRLELVQPSISELLSEVRYRRIQLGWPD